MESGAIGDRIEQLARAVADLAAHQMRMNEIALAFLARLGDPTHLNVSEVARIRRVSDKTIRRAIARGELNLEAIPGTRETGIPVQQVYSRWIDLRTLRAARLREGAIPIETVAP